MQLYMSFKRFLDKIVGFIQREYLHSFNFAVGRHVVLILRVCRYFSDLLRIFLCILFFPIYANFSPNFSGLQQQCRGTRQSSRVRESSRFHSREAMATWVKTASCLVTAQIFLLLYYFTMLTINSEKIKNFTTIRGRSYEWKTGKKREVWKVHCSWNK